MTRLGRALVGAAAIAMGCGGASPNASKVGPQDGGRAKDGPSSADGGPAADATGGDTGGGTSCGFAIPNPVSTGLPNPASYDTSTPGVVLDNVTGLMWEQQLTGQPPLGACVVNDVNVLFCIHDDALAYCAANRTGGYSDWRLPTALELFSLVDLTVPAPTINAAAFPGTLANMFWTVTPESTAPGDGWVVDFHGWVLVEAMTNKYQVRCVRGGTAPPARCYPTSARWLVQDGLVSDAATGLTWQETESGALPYTYAAGSCAALGSGFRLPSVTELLSLMDFSADGTIASVFVENELIDWTPMTVLSEPNSLWAVTFDSRESTGGNPGEALPNNPSISARCVR